MVPQPVAVLKASLPHLWPNYSRQRAAGSDPDTALDQALVEVVPPVDLPDLLAFLSGALDRDFGLDSDASGRVVREKLASEAENSYARIALDSSGPSDAFPVGSAADATGKADKRVRRFIFELLRDQVVGDHEAAARRIASVPPDLLPYATFHVFDQGKASVTSLAGGSEQAGDVVAALAGRAAKPHVRLSLEMLRSAVLGDTTHLTREIGDVPSESRRGALMAATGAAATVISHLCEEQGGAPEDYLDAVIRALTDA